MQHYRAPRWALGSGAAGGHLQTIWPALLARAVGLHLDLRVVTNGNTTVVFRD